MRRVVSFLGLVPALTLLAAGCAVADLPGEEEESAPGQEQVGKKKSQIFGGSIDTTHDAVVFVASSQGAGCTGTIIAKNGSFGYVLTAAHCTNMDFVVMDDDLACLNNDSCDAIWAVDEQVYHPDYGGSGEPYDFSLLRFNGATASTPVIPAASNPDGIAVGTNVDIVGYGLTEFGQTDDRMHVVMPVDQLDSVFVVFDQTGGQGPCSGDSGGPALFNNTVVGVTSFGDQNCTQVGVSGRVQAVYNGFIAPFIGAPVEETCETCFDAAIGPSGACDAVIDACFSSEQNPCYQLVMCLDECGANDDACVQACANAHEAGIDPYLAIYECTYCEACPTLCQQECEDLQGSNTTVSTVATVTSTGSNPQGGGGNAGNGGAPASGGASAEGGSTNNNDGGGSEDGNLEDGDGAEDGCGCATVGEERSSSPWAALGMLGLALAAWRRRRSR